MEEIRAYVARNDSNVRATGVAGRIVDSIESLAQNPSRGIRPRELREAGEREFRELFFKPYRVIYFVEASRVVVALVSDGRRNMRELLQRRLLEG